MGGFIPLQRVVLGVTPSSHILWPLLLFRLFANPSTANIKWHSWCPCSFCTSLTRKSGILLEVLVVEDRKGRWRRENIMKGIVQSAACLQKELANYSLRSKPILCHGFVKRAFIETQPHPFAYSLQWQSWLVTQQNTTETILPAKTNIYRLDICSSFGNILDQISVAQYVEQWLFYGF